MKRITALLLLILSGLFFSCEPIVPLEEVQEEAFTIPQHEQKSRHHFGSHRRFERHTYVLVHGAWHPEESWALVKPVLRMLGHQVLTMQLQGLGNDPTPPGQVLLSDHVNKVKEALNQTDEQVILVGHSYGGIVISQVAEDMPEKVKKAVYLSAFLPVNGETLTDLAMQDPASVVGQNLIIDPTNGVADIPESVYKEAFYNSMNSNKSRILERQVDNLMELIKPHPLATFVMPVSLGENFDQVDKVYVSCQDDHAITVGLQEFMLSRYPEMPVITMKGTDHSPFVTAPLKLIKVLTCL